MMLRFEDVKYLEELLRVRQRMKTRRGNTIFGSIRLRQKVPAPPDQTREMNYCFVHAVRAAPDESSSEGSTLDISGNEGDLRRVYLADAERDPGAIIAGNRTTREFDQPLRQMGDPGYRNTSADSNVRCAYYVYRKNGDLGAESEWIATGAERRFDHRIVVCLCAKDVERPMKRGSASWKTFTVWFVKGTTSPRTPECCRKVWEDDTLGRSPGLNLLRSDSSCFCIYVYVAKQTKEWKSCFI